MKKIKPEMLKYGDTIGVVGVSGSLYNNEKIAAYERAKSFFKNKDFKIKEGKYILEDFWGSAGNPKQKAEDFMSMIMDKDVKCIICLTGGETCNTFIDSLDYELIKQNPKIIIGYSDISVLLQAINQKTGLITYHGSTFTNFGNDLDIINYEEFEKSLLHNDFSGFLEEDTQVIRKGPAVTGNIVGTNLGSLMYLAGTEYLQNIYSQDSILFIESYKITINEIYRRFAHLKQLGVFDNIKAIVVGYNCQLQADMTKPQMENILLEMTKDYDFPIIKTNSFGHEMCNKTIPVGETIQIDEDGNIIFI